MNLIQRSRVINAIVDDLTNSLESDRSFLKEWVYDTYVYGRIGADQFSDDELLQAACDAGLPILDEPEFSEHSPHLGDVAWWVRRHYGVNFDAESPERKALWIDRYMGAGQ